LCGGYNTNINRLVLPNLKPEDEIYALGSKAVTFYGARKKTIRVQRTDIDVNFQTEQAAILSQEILELYSNGTFGAIKLAYTKFINNVTFEPTILDIFPIVKKTDNSQKNLTEIQFEPSAEVILETMVSLYLNTILYGTIIESQVSEQASRRTAMENATNNGQDLVRELSIKFNRERQAAITQEINEIVSGANAQSQ
jgi:F-type H+-transporting ATPase subunit gamma